MENARSNRDMNRKLLILTVTIIVLLSSAVGAAPLKDRFGIGLRGPFLAPFSPGAEYANFDRTNEPFMLGWNAALDVKLGLSDRFVLGAGYAFTRTYDDTLAAGNQTFSLNTSDNAKVRLRSHLLSLTGSYYFRPGQKLQPYVLAGVGTDIWLVSDRRANTTSTVTDLSFKGGAGASVWLTDNLTFDVEGRFSYAAAHLSGQVPEDYYGAGDWSNLNSRPFRGYLQPSIGFTWFFGGKADEDDDGVADKNDQCPGTPIGARVDKAGCPGDADGDGVYDGLDLCPATPAGAAVDASGCPLDSDKDGVFDGLDKCPETPPQATVDAFGCPLDSDNDGVPDYADKQVNTVAGARVDADGVALDTDGDGVPDGLDQCDDTPAGVAIDRFGCPHDADQDGVADSVDACPGTPAGVSVDATGCPVVKRLTETITLHINYAPGSFQPDEAARQELHHLSVRLYAYPETQIEIAGFTDNVGSETKNLELSQKRAQAVLEYLASVGIAVERMRAVGYGENSTYAVGDNNTAEGRRANRRVEIRSIETK